MKNLNSNSNHNLIPVEKAVTLDGLFYERTLRSADDIAYIQYDKNQQVWKETSWNQMASLVGRWQKGIADEKLEAGDRIAILMKNSKEWVATDQAALGLGLVTVPLYLEDRPDNIAYILEDAAIKLLFVQDISQWNRLRDNCADNSTLKKIILIDTDSDQLKNDESNVTTLQQWLPEQAYMLHQRNGDPDQLATIVYTSGTTGKPKGVMLSHHNILSTIYPTGISLDVTSDDLFLSFLPMSHTFERSLGYYLTAMAGSKVAFARSIQLLANDMIEIKPTLLISVPRIYERIYAKIEETLLNGSAFKRALFKLTIQVGWNHFLHQQKRSLFCPSCILWPLLKPLVADKVMQKFGGRLRLAATGGAGIPFPVAKTFISLGLTLIQGYGLTETSPVVSFNPINNNDPNSIGHPIDGVDVKIGDNDELLIKSPGVMLGYWNNHTATAQAIDADNWFHSGDQARIDEKSGHIYITGRIKDILIMSNGEKIPPTDIENTISMDHLFENALLLGEGQAYLGAVIVLNAEEWVHIAEKNKLDPFNKDNLSNKAVHNYIIHHLRKVLHDFPAYAKIRKVILTLDPWNIENGILTPTLKVKRVKVIEMFEKQIKQLYN